MANAVQRLEKQKQKVADYKLLKENIFYDSLEKIAVPSGNTLIILKTKNIVYIKGEGAYSEIFMNNRTKHLVSRNLKNFEDILQNDKRFIRIHKSFIVNFDFAIAYNKSDGGSLELEQKISLPVSSDKSAVILEKIKVVKR